MDPRARARAQRGVGALPTHLSLAAGIPAARRAPRRAAFVTKFMQDLQSEEQTSYAGAGSIADEVLRAVRTVVVFGRQEHEIDRCEGVAARSCERRS